MNTIVSKYVYTTPKIISDEYGLEISIPPVMIEEFKEVIRRGTAFGTQTSPEMKVFADTLLGRISYTSTGSQLESKASGATEITGYSSKIIER